MDHLYYPRNSPLLPLEIPFICINTSDIVSGSPHSDDSEEDVLDIVPYRLDDHRLKTGIHWYNQDASLAAAWAQTHLYFGFIERLLGSEFCLDDFIAVSMSTGDKIVTLKTLEKKLTGETRLLDVRLIAANLDRAQVLTTLSWDIADLIFLSIEVLSWTILLSSATGYNLEFPLGSFHNDGILQRRMSSAGWCPRLIQICCETLSAPLIYYISSMPRSQFDGNHETCNQRKCTAHDINTTLYVTQHVVDGCSCHSVAPDMSKITSIIQGNGIPIIGLSKKSSGCMELVVSEADFTTPYTAISHVWSGGLGNLKSNSLPQCQLERLYQLSESSVLPCSSEDLMHKISKTNFSWPSWNSLRSSTLRHIWIDTLCIPVEPQAEHIRQLAINNMALVYAAAKTVLVIDPALSEISMLKTSDAHILVSILSCAWMSRAWTFQEGSLAQSLSYCLRDSRILLQDWVLADIRHMLPVRKTPEQALFAEALNYLERLPHVMGVLEDFRESQHDLASLCSELALRSTTKGEDLHGILAVLLGLSPKEILALPLEQRTKALLRSQTQIPLSLLYTPGKALDQVRLESWVPNFPSEVMSFDNGSMKWVDDRDALEFSLRDTKSTACIIQTLTSGQVKYCIHLRKAAALGARPPTCHLHVQLQLSQTMLRRYTSWRRKVCFIFDADVLRIRRHIANRAGACFFVTGFGDDQKIRLRYMCPITYTVNALGEPRGRYSQCLGHKRLITERLSPRRMFELQCGESWYKPKFKRAHPSSLQKSPTLLITSVLCGFWMFYGAFMSFDSTLEFEDDTYLRNLESVYGSPWSYAISPLFVGPLVMRVARGLFPHTRRLFFVIAPLARLYSFYLLEYPRIRATTRRIRYQRFAATFDFENSEAWSRDKRLKQEVSYRYQTWWTTLVPISLFAYAHTRHPTGCRFNYFRRLTSGLVLETLCRLGAEIIWRGFGFDTKLLKSRSEDTRAAQLEGQDGRNYAESHPRNRTTVVIRPVTVASMLRDRTLSSFFMSSRILSNMWFQMRIWPIFWPDWYDIWAG